MKSKTRNKLIKLSATALLLSSSAVYANLGDINFIGSVSAITCDIAVVNDQGEENNVIDLGVMAPDGTGTTPVSFSLQPATGSSCSSLTTSNTVDVSWASSSFNSAGLKNNGGTAGGVHIEFKDGAGVNLHDNNRTTENIAITTADTFKADYTAQLVKSGTAAATTGTVLSQATFSVAFN